VAYSLEEGESDLQAAGEVTEGHPYEPQRRKRWCL
jgi:hypothetical protein